MCIKINLSLMKARLWFPGYGVADILAPYHDFMTRERNLPIVAIFRAYTDYG